MARTPHPYIKNITFTPSPKTAPVHMMGSDGSAYCGSGQGDTKDRAAITCPDCLAVMREATMARTLSVG